MNRIHPASLPPGLVFYPGLAALPQDEPIGGAPGPARGAGPNFAPQAPATGTEQEAPPTKKPGGDACLSMLPMLLIFGVFFYFFLIRPQRKQEAKRKALLAALKKNDKVVTTSGIYATVVALDEKTATLKIDEKGDIRVKFERSAVATILNRPGDEGSGK